MLYCKLRKQNRKFRYAFQVCECSSLLQFWMFGHTYRIWLLCHYVIFYVAIELACWQIFYHIDHMDSYEFLSLSVSQVFLLCKSLHCMFYIWMFLSASADALALLNDLGTAADILDNDDKGNDFYLFHDHALKERNQSQMLLFVTWAPIKLFNIEGHPLLQHWLTHELWKHLKNETINW